MSRRKSTGSMLGIGILVVIAGFVIWSFVDDEVPVRLEKEVVQTEDEAVGESVVGPRRSLLEQAGDGAEEPPSAEEEESKAAEEREVVLTKGPLRGLFGKVMDPDGKPVPRADVSLFVPEERKTVRSVASFDTGQFFMSTKDLSQMSVVLTASAMGYEPVTRRLEIQPDMDLRGIELELGRGNDLAGIVRMNGKPVPAMLSVDLARGKAGLYGSAGEVFWKDGVIVSKHGQATAGRDGLFRIKGLGPHSYQLRASISDLKLSYLPGSRVQQAQVPDENCEVDFRFVEQKVEVHADGQLLEDASLVVRHLPTGSEKRAQGKIELGLVPGERYQINAAAAGCVPRVMEFSAVDGDVAPPLVVDLEPAAERHLVIDWQGAYELGVRAIDVDFQPLFEPDKEAKIIIRNRAIHWSKLAKHSLEEGDLEARFRWDRIPYPPGRYQLSIRAKRAGSTPLQVWALPTEATVELPVTGEVVVSIPCTAGGALQFVSDAPVQMGPWGNWELRDSEGQGIERGFFDLSLGVGAPRRPISGTMLPAGTYALKIETDGNKIESYNVAIRPGQATELKVDLPCPPKPDDLGPWLSKHTLGGVSYISTPNGAMMFGGGPFF